MPAAVGSAQTVTFAYGGWPSRLHAAVQRKRLYWPALARPTPWQVAAVILPLRAGWPLSQTSGFAATTAGATAFARALSAGEAADAIGANARIVATSRKPAGGRH